METLRILLVDTGTYGHISTAGAIEYVVFNMAQVLCSLGHEVIVLSNMNYGLNVPKRRGREYKLLYDCFEKIGIALPKSLLKTCNKEGIIMLSSYKFSRVIERILNEYKVDVVHTHNELFALFSRQIISRFRNKITFIHTYHNAPPTILRRDKYIQHILGLVNYRVILKNIISDYDSVIVLSKSSRKRLIQDLKLNSSLQNKIDVIPNGVNTNFFNYELRSKKELLKRLLKKMFKVNIGTEDDKILIYAGRIEKSKGVQILPIILRKLKSTNVKSKLIIVGTGSYERELLKIIAKFRDIVIKVPRVPRIPLRYFYAISDILLFPSLGEGSPLTILESLAIGLPFIGFRIEPLTEYFDSTIFRSVLASSVREYVNFVLALMSNDEFLHELSREAVRIAHEFSWEKITAKYLEVYKKRLY